MIIKTQYRDVQWEEIEPCCQANGNGPLVNIDAHRAAWAKKRGTAIQIFSGPLEDVPESEIGCGGPFYAIVHGFHRHVGALAHGIPGKEYSLSETVCPHLAIIGD